MPSKAKKQPRAPARAPPSPSPCTPSTPSQGVESLRSSDDDEGQTRRILSEASARFPIFISESAFRGRVAEADSSHAKGNHARIWLSETAMVSASLTPGSLVSVSLYSLGKRTLNNFPLVSLSEECGTHFGIDVGDGDHIKAGNYFAIAAVFPSRRVLKDGVRLSWGLACTMGFPAAGTGIFVFPIANLSTSHQLFRANTTSHINLCQCEDLHLALVQPNTRRMNDTSPVEMLNDSLSTTTPNGKVLSPKTPLCQSKLSSPVSSPLMSSKAHDFTSSRGSSMCLDSSAIRLVLSDEKAVALLQIYAARWLCGRYFLCGNFVTIPLCGQLCIFRVESVDKSAIASFGQNLMLDGEHNLLLRESQPSNSVDLVYAAFLIGIKTKVHLHDPGTSVEKTSDTSGLLEAEQTYQEAGDTPKLGGLSKEFAALKEIIMFSLVNKDFAMPRYKGVLLHGPPGTGKTSLASFCAHDAGARLFTINGPEIVSQYYGESEQALHEVFESARQAAPAVVFIDELDAIAPARKDGGEELSLRLVATLLKLMDEISQADRILIIAATNRPDSIDPALRRPGRLDREIEIGVPSPHQRLDILNSLLGEMDHSLSKEEVHSLALATHGFVGADLGALCNEAALTALRRHIKLQSLGKHYHGPCAHKRGFDVGKDENDTYVDHMDSLSSSLSDLTLSSRPTSQCESFRPCGEEILLKVMTEDFEKAKMKVRPSAMREVMLEFPKVSWEDVGGQTKVKKQLIEAVQWPQLCPDAFKRMGIRPPRGLLMIGPPGCSKTLMARAVASEAKLNFLAVKGPELFSKWVGESEKAVKSLFAKARANAPAIIFFDEIDGLAITRGQENDGTSVADRVLSQLLVEMDGLDQRIGVIVIAATNRPDKIDPALLRPGRFDRLLDVQPPDENDREEIFHIHMRNMPCSSDVCIRELACLTEGYTGADIKLICREAAIAALEESLEISEVSMEHFKIGIGRAQPSDIQFYQELAVQFRRFVDSGSARDE